jgi:UDP-3-O-[3-hydroxymyristoyl] glucosamine N-acyltransferase
LIEALGGEIVAGSPEIVIADVSEISAAKGLDLVFAEDAGNAAEALKGNASAAVLKPGLVESAPQGSHVGIVVAEQPRLWFAKAAKLLAEALPVTGVHHLAILGGQVEIGSGATIAAGAIVGDQVKIGSGTRVEAGVVIGAGVQVGYHCRIYPRAVIYPGTTIGDRVVIHAGAVLGGDGFGYVRDAKTGAYTQFPQEGTLVIEDDVEIGANSTVDRGALAETRIRRGTKIDNLVHVGHNCDIGEDVILVALTGISGSSTVGNGAILAGQVGIGDHAHVGPGVILGGQAGVLSGKTVSNDNMPPGSVLWGTPARPLKQVLREQAVLKRLAARPRHAETGSRD